MTALKSNYQIVKKHCNGRLMAVIKGDAYGHGLLECAKALTSIQAVRLGVLDLEEALAIRAAGITSRIYVLAGLQGPHQYAKAIEAGVVVFAYRWEQIQDLSRAGLKKGKPALVMVKFDTGMGRLGFSWRDAETVIPRIAKLQGVHVEGVATHLATTGDREAHFQLRRFNDLKDLADKILPGQMVHSALASGGILAHPDYQDGMSRVGLMLYGYSPMRLDDPYLFDMPGAKAIIKSLKPVMSLKSQILSVTTIKTGDTVSYNRTFTAKKDTPMATIPIGYVHGVSLARNGKGQALIGGRKAPLLGRVCMNLSMYDVTQIAVLPGHEAVLLGEQGAERISADDIAQWEGTSAYEALCLTGRLNPRYYVNQ